jgi:hypothetical protein
MKVVPVNMNDQQEPLNTAAVHTHPPNENEHLTNDSFNPTCIFVTPQKEELVRGWYAHPPKACYRNTRTHIM